MEMTVVFGVALVLGAGMIATVCRVYWKKQILGLGGTVLTIFGVVLVGLSVWSTVQVKISSDGFEVQLEKLRQELGKNVAEVAEANGLVSEKLAAVVTNLERDRAQFGILTTALAARQYVSPDTLRGLESAPDERISVDPDQLRELSAAQREMSAAWMSDDGL